MSGIDGKIALVTGAGSGIGRGCAQALAAAGARVIVGDIDEAGGRQTCETVARAGGRGRFQALDVTSEAAWAEAIAGVERTEGALHILVNNAGLCISVPVVEMSFDAWKRQNAVNLDGVFLGTKAALPLMARSGGGSIVNISSVAGLKGIAGLAGYCATKGGVRLFTKAVALECGQARNGVRVNSIHPGAIETPIWIKLGAGGDMPELGANELTDRMEAMRAAGERATPLGTTGTPADIAGGVLYLCSDEARFVTGSELVIDGGALTA
ncbi:MAG TPA: SDR family oxidoreductase [Caulobacteraceae bacterium]|nr:SDR family oxidoreductase [Caulobacteraceae bacterium]